MSCENQPTNSYQLSTETLRKIKALKDSVSNLPKNTPGLYSPIYQTILNDVQSNPNVDQGTKNWLEVAIKVNAGDSSSLVFQYIREETKTALPKITDSKFTEGSNALGKSIVERILESGNLHSAAGENGLVRNDALAVVREFGGSLADWAGVTPYTLGDYYLGVETGSFTPTGKEKSPGWYFDVLDRAVNKTAAAGSEMGGGHSIASQVRPEFAKWFSGFYDWYVGKERGECNLRTISKTLRDLFNSGLNWTQPRDPLVLDLDADGIELTASNSAVLFDHNADTIKTGSQWVKSDDALLVRDINGNGSIDSGRELFGDQTRLANGPLAANGFAALADLDRDANGLSDGVFNAQDTAYSSLRIWRDLNQDGISQEGELQSLDQAGISAINLTANAQGTNALMGSFTRTITSTDAAGNTVIMQGAGMVRGLREAMSLGTVQAGGLAGLLATNHYKSNSELLNIHVGKVAEKLGKANKCRWTRIAAPICKMESQSCLHGRLASTT
jgi:hypothetical protein